VLLAVEPLPLLLLLELLEPLVLLDDVDAPLLDVLDPL
jgi:hypothetical protein